MQDKEKIREKYGPEWARLPPAQQDEIIDRCLVGPGAPAPRDPGDPGDSEELARFPGLRGPTGQKVVRFGDEVGTGGALSPPRVVPVGCGARGRHQGAGDGSGREGRPRAARAGLGAPQGEFENRREEEVFEDPPSRLALLGCPGSRDFSESRRRLLFSEADQCGNSKEFSASQA